MLFFCCEAYYVVHWLTRRLCKDNCRCWCCSYIKRSSTADPKAQRVWDRRKKNSGGNKLFIVGFVKA